MQGGSQKRLENGHTFSRSIMEENDASDSNIMHELVEIY